MGKTGGLRARRNKFNAIKTVVDGIRFDSRAEARRYGVLKLLEQAGEISWLRVHPQFTLAVNDEIIARYTADFQYTAWSRGHKIPSGKDVVEDVKSPPTAAKRDFVLIRKLMKAIHGIDVEIVS